jgi:hypothetical protein
MPLPSPTPSPCPANHYATSLLPHDFPVQGLPTIRAYGAGPRFRAAFLEQLSENGAWGFCFLTTGERLLKAQLAARTITLRLNTISQARGVHGGCMHIFAPCGPLCKEINVACLPALPACPACLPWLLT